MASFAQIDKNNIVVKVISVHNNELLDEKGIESELKGIQFCQSLFGENTSWKQTSYNTYEGNHLLNKTAFRKNYAGIGYMYDESRDAFIPPKPFPSWILDEDTCNWKSPVAFPEVDNNNYFWNEENQSWDVQKIYK